MIWRESLIIRRVVLLSVLSVSQVKMNSQERVKKEEEAARANLWGKVVTKEDLKRYENIKKEEQIERYENILQELKKREIHRTRVFYQALYEIYDPERRGGDKAKAAELMYAYHKL